MNPDNNLKILTYTFLGIFTLLFGAITLFNSFTIVDPHERGIRVVLGEIRGGIMDSGVNLQTPFITRIKTYDVSAQKVQAKLDVFSKDMQSVIVTSDVIFNYNPSKVDLLATKYVNDPVKTLLMPTAQECFKEVCKDLDAESIVTSRDKIRAKVNTLFQERLKDYEIFNIQNVVVSDIELSAQLNNAIEAKMVQDQEAKKAEFVKKQKQTEAETAKIIAEGKANAVREEAKAKADAIRFEAEANAESIAKVGKALKENPLALDELKIKKWNGDMPRFWGGGNQPMNVIFDAQNK